MYSEGVRTVRPSVCPRCTHSLLNIRKNRYFAYKGLDSKMRNERATQQAQQAGLPQYNNDILPCPLFVASLPLVDANKPWLHLGRLCYSSSVLWARKRATPCLCCSGKRLDKSAWYCTIPFWEECLKVVNTPNRRDRVAAIGTPGTGKTTSTPILIRMLLEENKTVLYIFRSEEKDGWYGTTSLFLMVPARSQR
jgi:hypothetical protein